MTEKVLSESLEDYLEAIFHIVKEKKAARPKDIARRLKVGNSSVTGALRSLASRELINYAPYEVVTLTSAGERAAQAVVDRHEALHAFFVKVLAVDAEMADHAACRMEHAVPKELLERFVRFVEFVEGCPRGGPQFAEAFQFHLESGCDLSECSGCLVEDGSGPVELRFSGDGVPETPTLDDVPPGGRCRVVRIGGEGALRRRLVDLGLTAGTEVAVARIAPLGDPLEIRVKGAHISLRRSEASRVVVERIVD